MERGSLNTNSENQENFVINPELVFDTQKPEKNKTDKNWKKEYREATLDCKAQIDSDISNIIRKLTLTKLKTVGETEGGGDIKDFILEEKISETEGGGDIIKNTKLKEVIREGQKTILDWENKIKTLDLPEKEKNNLLVDLKNIQNTRFINAVVDVYLMTDPNKTKKEIFKITQQLEEELAENIRSGKITEKEEFNLDKERAKIHKSEGYHSLKNIFDGLETEDREKLITNFITKSLASSENKAKAEEAIRTNYLLLLREEQEARKHDDKDTLKEIDKFRIFLADISSKLNANTKLKDSEDEEEKSYDELITIIADSVGKPKETIEKEIYQKPNSEKLLANLLETVMDPNSQDEPEILLQKFYKDKIAHA